LSYLFDTNVVSELRKGKRANAAVRHWIQGVTDDEIHLSVLVVGEIRQGIERIRRRDSTSADRLERWFGTLTATYAERILHVDVRVAELWGKLNVPDPLPAVDGLLAATALVFDLTLVTRNVRHVTGTGARILNPFEEANSP
jgi:predicted nucleic acid-binding protein